MLQLIETIGIKFAVCGMLTKISKWYKTDALNTDEEYHKENHQTPQYGDILDVTYVTTDRMIWQRHVLMHLCSSYY